MKTDIIRAAVTAVGIAVAGLGLSGTAHADGMTEAYVTVLHNEGIFALQGGDATLYAWGNWVCTEMGQGYTPTQIAHTVYTLASPGTIHMNYVGSQFFVGASVAALCPYYMPQPAQQPTQPQPAYERVVI
jgi:hypothetical protein